MFEPLQSPELSLLRGLNRQKMISCESIVPWRRGIFLKIKITIIRISGPISLSSAILKLYVIRLHMKFEGAISSYDQF